MNAKTTILEHFPAAAAILTSHVRKKSTVVLGLSGGPDSVFLLHLCLEAQKKHPFKIVIAHIDHGTRGKDSRDDCKFAADLAAKNRISFELHTIKTLPQGNLENAYRNIRYRFFEKVRKQHNAGLILTAHHLNDNIETVLLNLVRGCHLEGLKGIEPYDEKRHLLRPLLTVSKTDILAHLDENGIPFRHDLTNLDTSYSRNRIRHKVIPELKEINKNLEKTFRRNIVNFRELRDFNNQSAGTAGTTDIDLNNIDTAAFNSLTAAYRRNIIYRLYRDKYDNVNGLSKGHVDQILKIIASNKANSVKEFGGLYILAIKRDKKGKNKYIRILKKKSKQVK